MHPMKHLSFALAAAMSLALAQPVELAAGEHDRARRAYQAGEATPSESALARSLGRGRGVLLAVGGGCLRR